MALLFESTTCSRCGGSGHYSYCQRYGTTCFRCAGAKFTLTKRGSAAQALYTRLLSRRMATLKPGDKFRDILITMGGDVANAWHTVISVTPDTNYPDRLQVETNHITLCGEMPDKMVRVAVSPATKKSVADIALAYQAILSKSGKEPAWLKTIAY